MNWKLTVFQFLIQCSMFNFNLCFCLFIIALIGIRNSIPMYEKHRQNVLGGSTKLFTVYSQYELEQVVHFETS